MLEALLDVFLPPTKRKKKKANALSWGKMKWPDPDPLAAGAERAGWGTRAAGKNYHSQKAVRAGGPFQLPTTIAVQKKGTSGRNPPPLPPRAPANTLTGA